ncbi:hypothetical protein [Paenibacillus sp. GbtcB18]|uniref:hypothetical protein n=1 Tax=Paenibacillus sp. GbtcB18 TaxID=2824763 RepID=UPI001C303BD8|nr:hypothetical protein [Paenibacillus sp. GbtcB18]
MGTSSLFANDSVNDLNELCRDLHAALLLAESYHPKPIRGDAEGELRFWTAVTNVYGLFYDCMPYVFRTHHVFMRQNYNNQTQTLLNIMEQEHALSRRNRQVIEQYFRALTELRSIYCHNKPPRTIIKPKLDKVFGPFFCEPYHHQVSSDVFNFNAAYTHFEVVTQNVIVQLESGVKALILLGGERIISEWQKALIGWYLQSDDLRNRSVHHLRSIHGQIKYPWDINEKIEESFNKSGMTVNDLFDELVDYVDSSAVQIHSQEIWELIISDILS